VIKMYGDIVNFFGTADPVTRRMFEEILKEEDDHADDLADLLYTVDPTPASRSSSLRAIRRSSASITPRRPKTKRRAPRCLRSLNLHGASDLAHLALF
jgi:rubrerythrin